VKTDIIPVTPLLLPVELVKFLCRRKKMYNKKTKIPARRAEQAISPTRILLFKFWWCTIL